MADNVTVPSVATGPVIATDEIDGAQYQRVKLIHGSEGVNAGDVSEGNPLPVHDEDAHFLLTRLLSTLAAPLGYDKSLGRLRATVVIESGTVTTVTTVSSVSNLAAIGGYNASMQVFDTNRTAWAQCVRSRIS